MSSKPRPQPFREQMAQSMAELESIMARGESPSGNGRFTVRTIEIVEPSEYDADAVRSVRDALQVSQTVFARLVGVSDVLVRSWERGVRTPAPVARRLLDQIRAKPADFASLVRPATTASRRSDQRGSSGAPRSKRVPVRTRPQRKAGRK